jgi:glyoxylase-like metal-dependent hydrolase (beta-lactamase superfamily II)
MSNLRQISEHLYGFNDTCNVYLIKDDDHALLIDGGSGVILDHLDEAGVKQVDWVLHTHHHRDQCWGDGKLIEAGAKIAVPRHERHLFEEAELFWQTRRVFDNYNDRNTFFAIDRNIPVAAELEDYETFEWRGISFFLLPSKGHTLGSTTLIAEIDGRVYAFSGDLMCNGGVLYQLHAMEYTYGDMIGILFTIQSIQALRRFLSGGEIANQRIDTSKLNAPPMLLPSHGDPVEDPIGDVNRLEGRLMDLVDLGRGLRIGGRESIPERHFLPSPKFVPVSRHLLWGGPWTCSNFYVLLSESGKAMFIDYGHAYIPHMHTSSDHDGQESMRFVEHHLDELKDDYGVTDFDLVVPTHIHDDHTCGIPHLQRHYGAKCWALEEVGQVLADPSAWASTPCTFDKPITIDKWLSDGEAFEWEEYAFTVHFAPGQTEYHSVLAVEVDGKKVAFTGDNIFLEQVMAGGKVDIKPFQTTVLRNSFQLDMHRRCIDVMRKISPELICPGHRDLIPCDKSVLDSYVDFINRKERAFRNIVGEPADHYIDLFWGRLLPYVSKVKPAQTIDYKLLLRNNMDRQAKFEARLLAGDGWQASSEYVRADLAPGERIELTLPAIAPNVGDGIRRLLTAEIRIDGETQGPIAEALATVG